MKQVVIILLALLALTPSVSAQSTPPSARVLSWQGLYLGAQSVTPLDRAPRRVGDLAVTLNAIIGIKKRYSFQAQLIVPVNGSKPLYRLGFDWRMF